MSCEISGHILPRSRFMKCELDGSSKIAFIALDPTQIKGCVGMEVHVALARQYKDAAMTRDISSHLVKDGRL